MIYERKYFDQDLIILRTKNITAVILYRLIEHELNLFNHRY